MSLLRSNPAKFIIYPVVVGITIYLLEGIISNSSNDREISYKTDEIIAITIDKQNGITRLENGTERKMHYAHRVSFKNSGTEPLESVKIEYELLSEYDNISIIDVYQPESSFGEIDLENMSTNSATYNYELINPGQEWLVGIIHNKPANLKVNINHKGLVLNELSFLETLPTFMIVIPLIIILALLFLIYFLICSSRNLPTKEQWDELQVAWNYYVKNVKNEEEKDLLTNAKTS